MGCEGGEPRDHLQYLYLWRKLMVNTSAEDDLTIGFLYTVATSGDTWCLGQWRVPSRSVHVDLLGGHTATL